VPAHAQRMDSLLAADREFVPCRGSKFQNMLTMFVTLEVSKLSGWLNAYADCRVKREGHAMRGEVRGEVRAGRREGMGR
jgi:hypothetical protein